MSAQEVLKVFPTPAVCTAAPRNGPVFGPFRVAYDLKLPLLLLDGNLELLEYAAGPPGLGPKHDDKHVGAGDRAPGAIEPLLLRCFFLERVIADFKGRIGVLGLDNDKFLDGLIVVKIEAEKNLFLPSYFCRQPK